MRRGVEEERVEGRLREEREGEKEKKEVIEEKPGSGVQREGVGEEQREEREGEKEGVEEMPGKGVGGGKREGGEWMEVEGKEERESRREGTGEAWRGGEKWERESVVGRGRKAGYGSQSLYTHTLKA